VRRRAGAVAFRVAVASALAAFASSSQAADRPANTLRELSAALHQCLVLPPGPAGSALTIRFSLRRDGAVLGKPQITFAKLNGDAPEQRRFVDAVAAAFDRCLPAAITDALGGAIAGRPLSIRFVVRPRETNA
jgi:hypothetical protein